MWFWYDIVAQASAQSVKFVPLIKEEAQEAEASPGTLEVQPMQGRSRFK